MNIPREFALGALDPDDNAIDGDLDTSRNRDRLFSNARHRAALGSL
jgi:hypothetical protein